MTTDELHRELLARATSVKGREQEAKSIPSLIAPTAAYLLTSWATQKLEDLAGRKVRTEDSLPLPEQEPKTAAPSGQENFIESPAQTLDWQKRVQDEAIVSQLKDRAENKVLKGVLRKFAAKKPKEERKEESKFPHPPLISYLDDVGMMLKSIRNSAPAMAENAIKMASPGEVIAAKRAAMRHRAMTIGKPQPQNPELADTKAASEKVAIDPLFAAGLTALAAARAGHAVLKARKARQSGLARLLERMRGLI